MGKDAARRFFESVQNDPQAAAFEKVSSVADFAGLAVRLGAERGFQFSIEDVEALLRETAGNEASLSSAELEAVTGGVNVARTDICANALNTHDCVARLTIWANRLTDDPN